MQSTNPLTYRAYSLPRHAEEVRRVEADSQAKTLWVVVLEDTASVSEGRMGVRAWGGAE
jgi:hypothetical protein